jgi:hypothetical protein
VVQKLGTLPQYACELVDFICTSSQLKETLAASAARTVGSPAGKRKIKAAVADVDQAED